MKEVPYEYEPHPGSVPLSRRPLACMLGLLGPQLFWALLVEGGDREWRALALPAAASPQQVLTGAAHPDLLRGL